MSVIVDWENGNTISQGWRGSVNETSYPRIAESWTAGMELTDKIRDIVQWNLACRGSRDRTKHR
jgi:hypothetical protein